MYAVQLMDPLLDYEVLCNVSPLTGVEEQGNFCRGSTGKRYSKLLVWLHKTSSHARPLAGKQQILTST